MVNGCFWHGHDCNKRRPSTNAQFWQDKITRNRERDARNQALLQAAGWNVIVIWECQLSAKNRVQTLRELDIILSRIILAQNGSRLQPQSYSMGLEDGETATAAEATTPYGNTK